MQITQIQQVLISTYWNVNNIEYLLKSGYDPVLISTYWNVNASIIRRTSERQVRFNLNLLECKSENVVEKPFPHQVLISTYWNVNIGVD